MPLRARSQEAARPDNPLTSGCPNTKGADFVSGYLISPGRISSVLNKGGITDAWSGEPESRREIEMSLIAAGLVADVPKAMCEPATLASVLRKSNELAERRPSYNPGSMTTRRSLKWWSASAPNQKHVGRDSAGLSGIDFRTLARRA
jgi:hypothetical protein